MAFEGGAGDGASGGDDALAGLMGGAAAGAGGGGADSAAAGGAGAEGGGAEGAGGAGGDGGFQAPDWYEKLSAAPGDGESASNRDWAQAAGIKDLDQLAKVARDNQRALRDSGRVKVPGEGAKAEEIAAYHRAIGVPEDAKGYEIKGPEGVQLNMPLIERLAGAAHGAGIPKGAFEKTVGEFIQAQMDEAAQAEEQRNGEVTAKLTEWGAKKDENLAHINAAARALGLTREDMTWMRGMPGGAGRALDLMAKLGAGMAEDVMVNGGKGNFGISGAEAKAQIDAMTADPETAKKIMVPGSPERVRYDRLNKAWAEHQAAQQQAA